MNLVACGCSALGAVLGAALASRVQLLPDVIDISLVPSGAGVGSLVMASYGALRGLPHDRVGRLALFGTLLGGLFTGFVLICILMVQVLS